MSAPVLSHNPYRSPACVVEDEERAKDITLAAGEFLVRNEELLISGDVQLPLVCVHTGRVNDLTPQITEIIYLSRFACLVESWLMLFLMIAVCPWFLLGMFSAKHQSSPLGLVLIAPGTILLLGSWLILKMRRWTAVSLQISYFESQQWTDDRRILRRRYCVLAVLLVAVLQIWIWWTWNSFLMIPALLVFLAACQDFRTVRIPRCVNDVFFVTGFPVQHLAESQMHDFNKALSR